jgi:hypothetical protein
MPLPVFYSIHQMCVATGEKEFNYPSKCRDGTPSIPLELKLLLVFRALGTGTKFMDVSELSGYISENEGNRFFKVFCGLFRFHFQEKHIRPLEGAELIECMTTYARLGIPGCAGSMDATDVTMENIAAHLGNLCDGDKGVGFLYQCIVTHNRVAVDISGSYYMTVNDKTTVKYNKFVRGMADGEIYGNKNEF